MEDYHAWRLDKANLKAGPISSSMLKDFAINPYAWRWGKERETTSAMRTGSLFDLALTDADKLESCVVEKQFDNYKTKAAREWRDEVEAQGLLIVTNAELDKAKESARRVLEHEVAGAIMDGASCQVGVVGEIADIPAKCLVDIEPSADGEWCEHLFDYKTTSNGLDDESIRKSIGQWRYHWQAAFYRTLKNKVDTERHCENFGFIFQDTETLEVRVVILNRDDLGLGNRCVGAALKEFARCSHQGIKSSYRKRVSEVGLMPYHAMSEEDWIIAQES